MIEYRNFWNKHFERNHEGSLHDRIRRKHYVPCPGNKLDPTDRGQPRRFYKWANFPDAAHRLYWRIREDKNQKRVA